MHIAILGRQPAIGIAELERVFGGKFVKPVSSEAVTIDCDLFDIQKFGGILKAGKIVSTLENCDWHKVSERVITCCISDWTSSFEGKITLGISTYGFNVSSREVQKIGIILKQKLKKSNISLRIVPNTEPALSSATSHHNKLGLSANKIELLIIRTNNGETIIAKSTGSQNITAYAKRDQQRPKRDAFVGMLPPKLAQIMINLACGSVDLISLNDPLQPKSDKAPGPLSDLERSRIAMGDKINDLHILDPFCGTGVILQEAVLKGYSAYGTDLSEKMISYSKDNLDWLSDIYHKKFNYDLHEGDAMKTKWQQPIDAVVGETYLGQPFSAPPSPAKLDEVVRNCNYIITEFLKNLGSQIKPGTPICIAIPAWRDKKGDFTHLPLIATIARLGYRPHEFTNISQNDLLYYRENQVVARELLVLIKV